MPKSAEQKLLPASHPDWRLGHVERHGDCSITYYMTGYGRGASHYQVHCAGKGYVGSSKTLREARALAKLHGGEVRGARSHATKRSSGVRAVGGPYTVYYEKAGGEPVKTSVQTKREAILLACATSKMTGGYVTVNHKGTEVAACYEGAVVEDKRSHANIRQHDIYGQKGYASAAQLKEIRRHAVNDITREIMSNGIKLTWDQADDLGDETLDWMKTRLGLKSRTHDDGVTFRPA